MAGTMYPAPKGALGVEHVSVQPGVYEEDYLVLAERYPGASALKHYVTIFSHWHPCRGYRDDGWESFGDASGTDKVFVHQLIKHWVNPQNDVAVTLVLRYESPGLATREVPSSDRLFVAVTRLQHVDAEKEVVKMGAVSCAKGP